MDEDRYLDGELLNGRKRIISSAYEKGLIGDDLFQYHEEGLADPEDYLSTAMLGSEYSHNIGDESQRLIIEELMDRRHEELGDLQLQYMMDEDRNLDMNGYHSHPDLNLKFQRTMPRLGSKSSREINMSNSLPTQATSAQALRLRKNFSDLPYQNSLGAGHRLPIVPSSASSIDSLNYRNRMNNSLNLFRTNNDMPELNSESTPFRPGRNTLEFNISRTPGRPGPRRPGSLPPPPPLYHQNRPRGYLPQQPQHTHFQQQPMRSNQNHPPDYYTRGNNGRGPPRPGQRLHRLFVALYDYDPSTMSPNPEACEEELPFREGQIIKILGEKDPDGFYWGEAGGRQGFVPSNMISEVQPDDERVAQELIHQERGELPSGTERRSMGRDRWGDIYASATVKYMIALYDYDPLELSPNVDSEVELSFLTGDIIKVFGDMDDDGFYMGELNGVRGLVPSNFLTEAPAEYSGGGQGPRSRVGGVGPDSARRPPRPGGANTRGGPPPPRGQLNPGQRGADANLQERSPGTLKVGTGEQQPNRLSPGGGRGGRGGELAKDNTSNSKQQNENLRTSSNSTDPNNKPGPKRTIRGVPAVLPELISPITDEPSTNLTAEESTAAATTAANNAPQPNTNPITSKLPSVLTDAPGSLMQKFSDFTHSAIGGGGAGAAAGDGGEAAEGSILSKGKDLLFKRFGF